MISESNRRHLFISHHHKDDAHVESLTGLLAKAGYDVRNSSIRARPANQQRIEQGMVDERVIRRLLRMKISWASTVVVLIGKRTHERPWVNWEIEQAHAQEKRIVGIHIRGAPAEKLPEAFEKYGAALVNWNTDSIMSAIDGTWSGAFLNPDGSPRPAVSRIPTSEC